MGTKPRRILFVSHELTYTGGCTSLLNMCKAAERLGHQIDVWSKYEGEFSSEFEKNGFDVKIVPVNVLEEEKTITEIKKHDLALCNTIATEKYVTVLEKYIPTIWMIHEAQGVENHLKRNQERKDLLRNTKYLCCVSEYAKSVLKKYRELPIHVLHNCIEDVAGTIEARHTHTSGRIKFGHFARIQEKKGYDELIKAFFSLPSTYQEKCELYVSGQKYEDGFCKRIFEEIDGADNIRYLGYLKGKEYLETMADMDAVIVASRDESCSLVVLEGCMLGKPLIITENVGAKYMLNDKCALIAETNSAESLRKAIIKMIDSKEGLEKMGREARLCYETFAAVKNYDQAFSTVLEKVMNMEKGQTAREADKISVVIPIYNVKNYLQECMESVVHQTYMNLEIICIDDASTDNSYEIAASYAKQDERIMLLKNPRNIGAARSRNIGLQMAEGKYICFLDADDLYEPDFLEKLLCGLESQNADLCMCAYARFKEGQKPQKAKCGKADCELAKLYPEGFNLQMIPDRIFSIGNLGPTTKLYLKKFLLEHDISFQDIRNSNDVFFGAMSLAQARKIVFLPEVLVHYREHGGQTSSSRKFFHYCDYEAWRKLYHRLKETGLIDKCYKAYISRALNGIMYQASFLEGNEKENFFTFWREKGLKEIGMENCRIEDFLNEEQYRIYGRIKGRTEMQLQADVQEYVQVKKTPIKGGMELMFPFHLFSRNSRIFLCGRREICQEFSRQATQFSGFVKIVGMAEADLCRVALRSTLFDAVLICEEKREIAEKIRGKLLEVGVDNKIIMWDGAAYHAEGFLKHVYAELLKHTQAMVS